jgi:hypothetical protein
LQRRNASVNTIIKDTAANRSIGLDVDGHPRQSAIGISLQAVQSSKTFKSATSQEY